MSVIIEFKSSSVNEVYNLRLKINFVFSLKKTKKEIRKKI